MQIHVEVGVILGDNIEVHIDRITIRAEDVSRDTDPEWTRNREQTVNRVTDPCVPGSVSGETIRRVKDPLPVKTETRRVEGPNPRRNVIVIQHTQGIFWMSPEIEWIYRAGPPGVNSNRDNLSRILIKDSVHRIFDGVTATSSTVREVLYENCTLYCQNG
jgi:hypothetical protein